MVLLSSSTSERDVVVQDILIRARELGPVGAQMATEQEQQDLLQQCQEKLIGSKTSNYSFTGNVSSCLCG